MANWMSRLLRGGIAATLAVPVLLVGCGGIHLYNPGRETTAKDVKTKYAELKLPGVLAVMATAGLYDDSGKWLYHTGLPAKSGVGGGIVAVQPGAFAIATLPAR